MKVLVCADIHIRGDMPKCRDDESWLESQAEDLQSIVETAETSKADQIWVLGDLFDQARCATEAVNLVLDSFGKSSVPVKILCGNHDLPQHRFGELKRSSIGTVLHRFSMLETDKTIGLAAFPFGCEPDDMDGYMRENGLRIWATHQLTFPEEAARPPQAKGVLAQELLDKCPTAQLVLTGDYHHGYVYTADDGRRVLTPGCVNIQKSDMAKYKPRVYILDTDTLEIQPPVYLPIHGKVVTRYIEKMHAAETMEERFVESLESGRISIASFKDTLTSKIPELPKGVRDIMIEVEDLVNGDRI